MKDDSRMRDARMMNAVFGMGGRSVLSSEVDLRFGQTPNVGSGRGWLDGLVWRMWRQRKPGHTDQAVATAEARASVRPLT